MSRWVFYSLSVCFFLLPWVELSLKAIEFLHKRIKQTKCHFSSLMLRLRLIHRSGKPTFSIKANLLRLFIKVQLRCKKLFEPKNSRRASVTTLFNLNYSNRPQNNGELGLFWKSNYDQNRTRQSHVRERGTRAGFVEQFVGSMCALVLQETRWVLGQGTRRCIRTRLD